MYKALVRARISDSDGRYSNLLRLLSGYGSPAAVVLATLIIAYAAYEGEAYGHNLDEDGYELCWLQEDTFIWAFMAPVAVVMVLNLVVLLMCLRVAFQVWNT